MKKYWLVGLLGGMALAFPGFGGEVKTDDALDVDITLGGQVRARYDYRDNLTYGQGAVHASDDASILRTRFNLNVKASDGISAFVEFQDSHTDGAATTPTATGSSGSTGDAGLVMNQAYLAIEDLFDLPVDLLAGRMNLHYGDGRVINDLQWSNSPRHFDGARLRYSSEDDNLWIDAAWLQLQNRDSNAAVSALPAAPANPDDDYDVYVLYGHTEFENSKIEVYNVWEHDGLADRGGEKLGAAVFPTNIPGDLNRHTTGFLLKYQLDDFKASFEYMHQWGNSGIDRIDADALAFVLNYNISDLRFEYELTSASGDGDPNDGVDGRFKSPFHFNHKYHGYADVVGFTNMTSHKLQVASDLNEKNTLTAAWHFFQRNEHDDSWYGANSATVLHTGKNLGGVPDSPHDGISGSRDIGQEFDIKLDHKYSKNLSFELGWAHFMGGHLLHSSDSTLGDQDYIYLQTMFKF